MALAREHNCTTGDDAAIRACLRAVPWENITAGGDRTVIDGVLIRDLPFNLYVETPETWTHHR